MGISLDGMLVAKKRMATQHENNVPWLTVAAG